MESGSVVEYIDRQKVLCAVVLEARKQRVRLLTENNREINLSENRLSHKGKTRLDLSMGRDNILELLKKLSDKRKTLIRQVDVKELWEVLNSEQEWIDLVTMTELCFPNNPSGDHESAVFRAFFENRIYFKFNHDRFFPNTEKQVEKIIALAEENARINRTIEKAGDWLRKVLDEQNPTLTHAEFEYVDILKSIYISGKESRYYNIGKSILARAGQNDSEDIFHILVKLGEWDENENLDLYRYETPIAFSDEAVDSATRLVNYSPVIPEVNARKDLTALPLMTIDGQATLDFDDAISLENEGNHYRLGIHIADVAHFIKKGDIIDQEALSRGSSIYMPDQKIPMLPASLAEDLCSLKAGKLRPAISTMVKLTPAADVIDYEIVPSWINVSSQLSYYDVNLVASENPEIAALHDIARKFRQYRLSSGAIQISLPDINVWIDYNTEVSVNRINRESPGRMLVAEIMIMANWLTGRFLTEHKVPAIFRSQPAPRERLYKEDEGSLFQNWMQRKLLSRFALSPEAQHHSGLGLEVYTTATSPIRKFFDLVTQRQVRAALGFEKPYTTEEIEKIIQMLEQPMASVGRIQYSRHRYWILKYLEKRIGQKEEAIVLYKRRNNYLVLIPEYMIECDLPLSDGFELKPEDLIQVKIQRVDARKDVLSIFMS
ncbi:ribonuclease catalytic domain-containing protein [Thermodesulfobacteriota bacterium]